MTDNREIAVAHRFYYTARFGHLLGDLAASCFVGVLISPFIWDMRQSEQANVACYAVLVVFLVIKILRSLNVLSHSSENLRVYNSRGERLSVSLAIWRALLLVVTLPLLPLQLFVVAFGGRQFPHDVLSAAIVRPVDEDPATCFYPPPPRWWLPSLLLGAAFAVTFLYQGRSSFGALEAELVPKLLSKQSGIYYQYLSLRHNIVGAPDNPEDAALNLWCVEDLSRLRMEMFGIDNDETVTVMLYTANLAATAHEADRCLYWLEKLKRASSDRVAMCILSSDFLPIKKQPESQFAYFIDRSVGLWSERQLAESTSSGRMIEMVAPLEESAPASAECRSKLFGEKSEQAAIGYLNAAIAANRFGDMRQQDAWLEKLFAVPPDVLGRAVSLTDVEHIDYNMPPRSVLAQLLVEGGLCEVAATVAQLELGKAIKSDNVEQYYLSCRTLAYVFDQAGSTAEADKVRRAGINYLQEREARYKTSCQCDKCAEIHGWTEYLQAVADDALNSPW